MNQASVEQLIDDLNAEHAATRRRISGALAPAFADPVIDRVDRLVELARKVGRAEAGEPEEGEDKANFKPPRIEFPTVAPPQRINKEPHP